MKFSEKIDPPIISPFRSPDREKFHLGNEHYTHSSPEQKHHKPHRSGRPLRINLMSRYICFSQNGCFDVSFEELFSKVQNPGGFFRKKRFLGSIFGFFSCSVAISEPICMKFWLPGGTKIPPFWLFLAPPADSVLALALALEPKFHEDWCKNGHATRKKPKNGP